MSHHSSYTSKTTITRTTDGRGETTTITRTSDGRGGTTTEETHEVHMVDPRRGVRSYNMRPVGSGSRFGADFERGFGRSLLSGRDTFGSDFTRRVQEMEREFDRDFNVGPTRAPSSVTKFPGGWSKFDWKFDHFGHGGGFGRFDFGNHQHHFTHIDPTSGRIRNAIDGSKIFGFGGKHNEIGDIGKRVLDNKISGRVPSKAKAYVPPKPKVGAKPDVTPSIPEGGQIFKDLRDQCLKNKTLFEDPTFPATDRSVFFSKPPPCQIVWKRPGEICQQPQLFIEGHPRFDVVQGELGDCWLIGATADLTMRDELFYRVVPPDQSFVENYAGIFHFQFWQFGQWVDVVVDDRLPTGNGRLLYMHSPNNVEFWPALLEKAYAKLNGSYEVLTGGAESEALEDFTGGVTETFDIEKDPPANCLQIMFKTFQSGGMLGASILSDTVEGQLANGLVTDHAYSITGMQQITGPSGQVPLIRLRNPWGEKEWNGAWSDNSSEWNSVPEDTKKQIGLVVPNDGEFWMSYNDFMANYVNLEICTLGPEVMDEISALTDTPKQQLQSASSTDPKWTASQFDGAWKNGVSAGGCRNNISSFATNPQYSFTLSTPDPNDPKGECVVIIGLCQKYRRQLRSKGLDNLPIGFAIYQVQSGQGRLDRSFFEQNNSVAKSGVANGPSFINIREVANRFTLPPGSYVVVPSTYDAGDEAEFLIRIFAFGAAQASAL